MKRFRCTDVISGCDAVFTGAGDQSVLDQVLHHAAAEHGLVRPQLPFIELVMTYTRPFTPTHPRQHLRAVAPTDPGRRPDTTNGRHEGGRMARETTGVRRARPTTTVAGHSNVHPLRPTEPSRSGGAHETYRHECLLYAGSAGSWTPWCHSSGTAWPGEEPVMVAVAEPRLQALRSALGEDADAGGVRRHGRPRPQPGPDHPRLAGLHRPAQRPAAGPRDRRADLGQPGGRRRSPRPNCTRRC